MQRASFRPEFQHVAEHGDAPAVRADRRLAEQSQRRRDRGRIGVVALVDDERRAAGQFDLDRRAAAGDRLELGERQRREREIGADQFGGRQHRERIMHEMAARRADLVGEFGAEDLRLRPSSSADAARI